ncbi:hypothetical protein Lfu02_04360 [Longispora fulva]|uniref:Uncharacterized protein n=1 Tax=Longispora fulva TaxID=619741 RepID=A0A8J7GFN9_9ACTN|nr:hypothetical protein [Longispora fulva]GIG56064.1 hypothetical protein Lfu02_04360 [Longispora fulva]
MRCGDPFADLLGVQPTATGRHAARGRTAVGLGVDTSNPTGAYHLYRSVGMAAAYVANIYQLTRRL